MLSVRFNIPRLKVHPGFDLSDVSFAIAENEICAWIGNNGSGKTSLINVLTKNAKAKDGMVFLGGTDLNRIACRRLAQYVSYVPQINEIYGELSVHDFVSVGRLPHTNFMGRLTKEDKAIVARALADLGIERLRDRRIGELSGGQRQKAIIASALAQQTPLVVLDEPLNHLDAAAKDGVIALIGDLKSRWDKTVIVALHDFEVAANLADKVACFHGGSVRAFGAPKDVITPENLKRYFGVDRTVDSSGGKIRVF